MQKFLLIVFLLFLPPLAFFRSESDASQPAISACEALYSDLKLSGKVDYPIFERAWAGYRQVEGRKKEVLTLIDFTKPSSVERLYVIDVNGRKILFETHVAHGQNSGGNYATAFSNRPNSHQSSLGFYLTGNTYTGCNGYSLMLDGLEAGINDNARSRAVVVHGAAYAEPSVVAAQGRLGRSWGCPALPASVNRKVIDAIKNGSVLFIYADDDNYLTQSPILSSPVAAS